MNTALAVDRLDPNTARRLTGARAPEAQRNGIALTRASAAGRLSLLGRGPVAIEAEAGLVVHVHSGCLWMPHHEDHCSVGVAAGEAFVLRRGGSLAALAERGTQVTLQWPARAPVGGHAIH